MKKKILLVIICGVLLLLSIFIFHWLTNSDYQTLPPADGSQITIVSYRDARIGVESKTYEIPNDTELFTEYSTLLNSMKLRRCTKDFEMGPNYYMITYPSGSPGESQSVRILFNEDENDIYFHVLISRNHEDPVLYDSTCKMANMEAWRELFRKLLEASEVYIRN